METSNATTDHYCRMATEDLQKCVDHVIAEHGDKVLKLKTVILNENTGKHGMMSKKLWFRTK